MERYYDRGKMEQLELQLEKIITSWPHTSKDNILGCPGFKAKDQLLCFLITEGIVFTNLTDKLRKKLTQNYTTSLFDHDNSENDWIRVELNNENFTDILHLIERNYHVIMTE